MEIQLQGSHIASLAAELLIQAGLVDRDMVDQAQIVASHANLPIGRVLVMSGHVADADLTSSLKAAKLVLTEKLSKSHAITILRQSYVECLPLEIILERQPAEESKLGELLSAAHVVEREDLAHLQQQAKESGLTLGRVLVLAGTISAPLLTSALDALMLLRDRNISFDHGVRAVQAVASGQCSLQKDCEHSEALAALLDRPIKKKPRLGELLVLASILSETDALNALEIALENEKPVGQVLFEQGLLPPLVLKAALRLQEMIENGIVTLTQACEIIRQVQSLKVPVERVLDELGELKARSVDFLKRAKILSDTDIDEALKISPCHSNDATRALLATNRINLQLLKAAVRCLTLMQARQLTFEEAVTAITQCRQSGLPIEAALKDIAWRRVEEPYKTAVTHAFPVPLYAITLTA